VFGGQRGPVADALNLNAGVALAAAKVLFTSIKSFHAGGSSGQRLFRTATWLVGARYHLRLLRMPSVAVIIIMAHCLTVHIRMQVAVTPQEGIAMAQDAQRSGRAGETLSKWVEVSQDALAAENDGHQ